MKAYLYYVREEDKMIGTEVAAGAAKAGVNKAAEQAGTNAFSAFVNFIKKKYGEACVDTTSAFRTYLENAMERYNKVKTLADLTEPRDLEGENGIYVDGFVQYKEDRIPVTLVRELLGVSNKIVLTGTGGIGKTMLMRHLFVSTYQNDICVPVLVELRRMKEIKSDNALLELIHAAIENFDVKLSPEQFEYSLRSGTYLFLFDGLDEVNSEWRDGTAKLIQDLSNRYPKNAYIVSSRKEGVWFNELQTFTIMEVCPWEKKQAVELVLKLGKNSEKAMALAKQLGQQLFNKHRSFASNPLLLTMMYIVFVDNNNIPDSLIDFYEKAYSALYNRHDASKDGLFRREYQCKNLGEKDFKDLFSYYCFQSLFREEYEFSKDDIIRYIENGIQKLNLAGKIDSAECFFNDIKNIVCLIVTEGDQYKFAHRSFQTYFAAYYMATFVSDEKQKQFIKEEFESGVLEIPYAFLEMLYKLEGERFLLNVLEPGVQAIFDRINCAEDKSGEALRIYCSEIGVESSFEEKKFFSVVPMQSFYCYTWMIVLVFKNIFNDGFPINESYGEPFDRIEDRVKNFLFSSDKSDTYTIKTEAEERCGTRTSMSIDDFIMAAKETKKEMIIDDALKIYGLKPVLDTMFAWLTERKEQRNQLSEGNDRNSFLSSL